MNAFRITVNNGGFVEIERTKRGFSVGSFDKMGCIKRRDGFDEGEIIMALNLLRNMRSSGEKSAYLLDDFALKVLRESGAIDYAEEYRIFQ